MTTSAWYPDTGSVSVLPTELWSISEPAKHLDRALLSLLFQPTYEADLNLVTVASWHSAIVNALPREIWSSYESRFLIIMKSYSCKCNSNWTIKQRIDHVSLVSRDSGPSTVQSTELWNISEPTKHLATVVLSMLSDWTMKQIWTL